MKMAELYCPLCDHKLEFDPAGTIKMFRCKNKCDAQNFYYFGAASHLDIREYSIGYLFNGNKLDPKFEIESEEIFIGTDLRAFYTPFRKETIMIHTTRGAISAKLDPTILSAGEFCKNFNLL